MKKLHAAAGLGFVLAAALFGAGCSKYMVYQPTPQAVPSMTPAQARQKIAELLRRAVKPYRATAQNVQVTITGFSLVFPANKHEPQPEPFSFQFENLRSLSVFYTGDWQAYEVNLGAVGLHWNRQPDAVAFVNAIEAIRFPASGRFVAADAADFAAFQEKAKAWRALPEKPELAEETRRAKAQAEDAFRSRDFERAIDCYDKGLAATPLWPEGQFNSALLCGEAGMYAKAVCHMKRYLELRPDAQDAQAARDKMYVWEGKIEPAPAGNAPAVPAGR